MLCPVGCEAAYPAPALPGRGAGEAQEVLDGAGAVHRPCPAPRARPGVQECEKAGVGTGMVVWWSISSARCTVMRWLRAGGVLRVEVVRRSGLETPISAALTPWRKPRAVHDPDKTLLDPAWRWRWAGTACWAVGGHAPGPTAGTRDGGLRSHRVQAGREPGRGWAPRTEHDPSGQGRGPRAGVEAGRS